MGRLVVQLMAAVSGVLCACSGAPRGGEESRVRDDRMTQAPAALKPAAAIVTGPPKAVTVPEQNSAVAEALRYDPADPLADLEKADALDRGAGRKPELVVDIPARGCALVSEPRRVWQSPGIATVTALGTDFIISGYARDARGERVFVVRVMQDGTLEPVATLPVLPAHPTPRVAAPGMAARADQGVTLAFSDGQGTLFVQQLQIGAHRGAAVSVKLATGTDTRFAPAVSFAKSGALIAYTLGETPMRTQLVRMGARGDVLSTHEIKPDAMAAAAPTFVAGTDPALLITADPRDGMSPIARTPLDLEGKPSASEVAAPVGMMSQPVQLTAAKASFGTFVAYTGLGSAATSAVGLVQILPKPGSPEALVKGTAYGALHVASAQSGGALVFAADSPLSAGKEPKHDITLTRMDANGRTEPLHIVSPTGDAQGVALAAGSAGVLGIVFRAADGVYLAKARCAP